MQQRSAKELPSLISSIRIIFLVTSQVLINQRKFAVPSSLQKIKSREVEIANKNRRVLYYKSFTLAQFLLTFSAGFMGVICI